MTLFCRRKETAEQACEEIRQKTGNGHVDYILADLSDLEGIKERQNSISKKKML